MAIPAGDGIPAFRIDRHEVTVGQWRAFVAATRTVTAAEREGGGRQYLGGWRTMPGWTWKAPYGTPASDDEPAAHITFDEATAYCRWAGLRLPRDAEWVRAGYTETRPDPPSPLVTGRTYAHTTGETARNWYGADPASYPGVLPAYRYQSGSSRPVRVRTTTPGVNGLYDMGGNVWEWTMGGTADTKPIRGGSWATYWTHSTAQTYADRETMFSDVGFRCAAD